MSETLFKQVNYTALVPWSSSSNSVRSACPTSRGLSSGRTRKCATSLTRCTRGYPVGYLLFWQNGYAGDSKPIGTDAKQKVPKLLIVDGQQRLTSLYAVLRGIPVVHAGLLIRADRHRLQPSRRELSGHGRGDPKEPEVSSPMSLQSGTEASICLISLDQYLEGLRSSKEVTEEEEQTIKKAITKLHALTSYPFTALELASSIDEEQVADVFVRINSKGTPLNQSDFILTLMSVFWDEGRAELETFSRAARVPTKGAASPTITSSSRAQINSCGRVWDSDSSVPDSSTSTPSFEERTLKQGNSAPSAEISSSRS